MASLAPGSLRWLLSVDIPLMPIPRRKAWKKKKVMQTD